MISALADTQGDRNAYVRGSVHGAFESFWIALKELEENLALKETNFEQISDCPSTSFASAPIVSLLSVKDSLLKVCQQSCLAGFQASNYRVRREALEMLFKTNQALSKALESIQTIRVSSALSWLESTVPSVVKMLGDKKATVRRALIDALSSCLSVLAKLSERCESVLLKVSNLEVCSDCPERADSQASASITTLKASLVQSCLKGCIVALKDKDWHTRLAAAVVIGKFAENQIKNLSSALQISWLEYSKQHVASLKDLQSEFQSVISALADTQGDRNAYVRGSVHRAFESFWIALKELEENLALKETNFEQISDCPSTSFASAPIVSLLSVKDSLLKVCQQSCLAGFQASNYRVRREALEMLFKTNQALSKALESIQTIRVSSALSWLESTVPSVVKMLGDKKATVRRALIDALSSCLSVLAKLSERCESVLLKVSNLEVCSDCPERADSQASASITTLKASLVQSCLKGCIVALKDKDWHTRLAAAVVIRNFAAGNVSSFIMAVQDPEMAAGLSDALSTCKAIVFELGKKGVEHVEEAIRESWVRIGLDAGACADSTDAHCGFGHPDSSSGSLDALAIAKSFAELKAEVVQRCLQACSAALKSKRWRIRQEAARLLGTFAENQIKNLPSAPGSIGNEATTNMAKLDAPALFESVISALAGALGDVDPDVQDTAYSAYRSLWIAFDKFEKRLTPQADNVGQVSDVRDPANCSSATASHQELNAAMFQCCLQRCFSELKNGPTRAREMVARLIGILARNQIKNLASALGTSPGKDLATTAKLNQLPSLFASVVSALAGALDDQYQVVRECVREELESIWATFEEFDERLKETNARAKVLASLERADSFSAIASLAQLKAAMFRCCLDRCVSDLKNEHQLIREGAASLLGTFAENQIKNLPSAPGSIGKEATTNMAKLDAPSLFESVISALAGALEDEGCDVQREVHKAFTSLWIAFDGPTGAWEMVARLIGILARNQIKNLASALGTSPGKDLATTAKLNQLPSLFASVVSALAGALGAENHVVRERVREEFESIWAAFEEFDERLKETNARAKVLASLSEQILFQPLPHLRS